jgi:hypothetical protein
MQSLPNPANLPPPVRASSPMVAHESILQRFRSPKSITFRVQVTGMMPQEWQEWQECPKDDSFVHPFVAQPSGQLLSRGKSVVLFESCWPLPGEKG